MEWRGCPIDLDLDLDLWVGGYGRGMLKIVDGMEWNTC